MVSCFLARIFYAKAQLSKYTGCWLHLAMTKGNAIVIAGVPPLSPPLPRRKFGPRDEDEPAAWLSRSNSAGENRSCAPSRRK